MNLTKLVSIMGAKANSPDHLAVVKRVLQSLMYEIATPDLREGTEGPVSSKSKSKSHQDNRLSNVSSSKEETKCHEDSRLFNMSSSKEGTKPSQVVSEGRKQTLIDMKENGFVTSFVGVQLCQAGSWYIKYGDGDTAFREQSAQLIHRYVDFAKKQVRSEYEALKSTEAIDSFARTLGAIVRSNTLRNHAAAMSGLMDLLLHRVELKDEYRKCDRQRLLNAKKQWVSIKNQAEKRSRIEQRKKVECSPPPEAPIFETLMFLKTMREKGTLESTLAKLEADEAVEDSDLSLVLCYMACLFALNAQRQCAFRNVKFSEVRDALSQDGKRIVKVQNHKTDRYYGASCVVLTPGQWSTLFRFAELRSNSSVEQDPVIMNTLRGTPQNAVFRPLELFIRGRFGHSPKLTFNLFRKTVESYKNFSSSQGTDKKGIARFLSHSRNVTATHYEYRTPAVICHEYRLVEDVLFQAAAYKAITDGHISVLPDNIFGMLKMNLSFWMFHFVCVCVCVRAFHLFIYFYAYLYFSEPFPDRKKAGQTLAPLWNYSDLAWREFSEHTYSRLTAHFRETHRDVLVRLLAKQVQGTPSLLARNKVNSLLDNYPQIWREDSCSVIELVLERCQRSRNAVPSDQSDESEL